MSFKRIDTTANRIKTAMNNTGKKQADIVRETGINKGALSHYLKGTYEPKQDVIFLLAKALNVSEMWLWGYDCNMERISEEEKTLGVKHNKGVQINVLGKVAAGIPIEAIENIVDTEEISEKLARTGEFFGLKIEGDSMQPSICNGDTVIVKKQDDANTGDIIIALVNGDNATCKRLVKYEHGISLISLNPSYEPMVFSKKEIQEKPVRIIGRVVENRRKF